MARIARPIVLTTDESKSAESKLAGMAVGPKKIFKEILNRVQKVNPK
ncbi:MAG TPA: hypothetical protein VL981_13895 [Candidatus Methylacidiphilales bacterium]|nr:hypothetical protein [Candidatus Methylacidiphilales bacterium]